jgi:diketogulonate reductase-like aldo/keto reductase
MKMPRIELPSGVKVATLGLGTWRMGENKRTAKAEIAALKLGLDLGMDLIDTAEMYGEGGAEELVGQAIAGRRDNVTLVSKVYPHNASRRGVIAACERSLKRMQVERIDLYLLHWRGSFALSETVEGFLELKRTGKIGEFGVSNFDTADMEELWSVPGGSDCAANQVLFNLGRRGIEFDLLPWCRKRGVAVMAYTPLEPARLAREKVLQEIATRHRVKPLQVALAWVLRHKGVIAIPKASKEAHVRENRGALDFEFTAADLELIDATFPPPRGAQALQMI